MRKRDIMLISLPYANTVDVNAIRSDLVIYFEKKMSESRQRTYSFCFSFIYVYRQMSGKVMIQRWVDMTTTSV